MAHFAELDENNVVLRVIVIDNNDIKDENGVEQESIGVEFCHSLFGGIWKQTSYNGKFRKNYAGQNYFYDETSDAFIPPKPYPSWVLNETNCQWYAPIPMPTNGYWSWNEETQTWIEVTNGN